MCGPRKGHQVISFQPGSFRSAGPKRSTAAVASNYRNPVEANLTWSNRGRLPEWWGRNEAFLLTLRDSGVRFLAVDMPEANDLTVGIMALVAQAEREAISRRTKEALAVARARGVKLGNPNGAEALRRAGKGAVALRAAVAGKAYRFAEGLAPVLANLRGKGHLSLRAVAAELNRREMRTRRGGRWQVSNVRNLAGRLG
jgi:hypothetical protein